MTIQEMHYDFKRKLNKIDSQQYRNFRVPEIDWLLNEAYELFVKMVAKPRNRSYLGFEKSQRTIDDIRVLVVNGEPIDIVNNILTLPQEYLYYIDAEVLMDREGCEQTKAELKIRQHDDSFKKSEFDKSSFEWREVNGIFFQGGIKLFDDGTFTNSQVLLSYIKKLQYIHNAENYRNGTYNLPSGQTLTGTVDCELPEQTHREIVDIAVYIASEEIDSPKYQQKLQKLTLNNLR